MLTYIKKEEAQIRKLLVIINGSKDYPVTKGSFNSFKFILCIPEYVHQ
jgi:hypothetical protein